MLALLCSGLMDIGAGKIIQRHATEFLLIHFTYLYIYTLSECAITFY